jgi:hypothetical protein
MLLDDYSMINDELVGGTSGTKTDHFPFRCDELPPERGSDQ